MASSPTLIVLLACLLVVNAYKLSKLELVCGPDYHDWYIGAGLSYGVWLPDHRLTHGVCQME